MLEDIPNVVRYQKYSVGDVILHSCTGSIVVTLPTVTGSSGHDVQGKGF